MITGVEHWDADTLDGHINLLAETNGVKKYDYYPILRLAVSGQGGGPDLLPMLAVLGCLRVKRRIERFMFSMQS